MSSYILLCYINQSLFIDYLEIIGLKSITIVRKRTSLRLIFKLSCLALNINNYKAIFKDIHWIVMIDRIIEALLREQLSISTI